jgi:hypothetical protein
MVGDAANRGSARASAACFVAGKVKKNPIHQRKSIE